jgi:hypothetical protein
MTNIGIYSTGQHENILYNICKISQYVDYNITVCAPQSTGETVQEHLGNEADSVRWILKADNTPLRKYLAQIETLCNNEFDLLYFQAMYESNSPLLRYIPFSPDCKFLFRIHNVNRWLNSKFSLQMNFRNNLHAALRKLFLRKIDALLVEYPPMAEYIQTEFPNAKPVHTFVPTVYKNTEKFTSDTIRFAVPGYIESGRRDYELVLNVFESLFKQYGDRIALHLLGSPRGEYGDRILNHAQALENSGYNVAYYDDWVPMEEFESTLLESTFLLNPIHRTYTGYGVTEWYSTTKGSGCYIDALRTGTALLLPAYFHISNIIRDSTVTYQGQSDLEQSISTILDSGGRLDSLRQAAHNNSAQFTLDKQADRFTDIVSGLLNN